MINIRSITVGIDLEAESKHGLVGNMASFMNLAENTFEAQGRSVRTRRLTLPPLNQMPFFTSASARSSVNWISDLCEKVGVRWFCVPLDYVSNDRIGDLSNVGMNILRRHSNAFVNLIVAKDDVISTSGVAEAARFVRRVSRISNNGFDNFRVGLSCNCDPHTPFFPFSFHNGKDGFSVGLELVDEFIEIIQAHINDGIEAVRDNLLLSLIASLEEVNAAGVDIETETGIRFLGIDASLAPFPNSQSSVARIVEMLGYEDFGSNGSLFYTAFLTDIIKTALRHSGARRVGFNGVMYSLLEDDCLALRNSQKNLTLDGLMMYSAVCGCGIDMVPVPGDILDEEIESITLDVASMAITLRKPLGVRILPINGGSANEHTRFNYDFLVDTRIIEVRNRGIDRSVISGGSLTYLRDLGVACL